MPTNTITTTTNHGLTTSVPYGYGRTFVGNTVTYTTYVTKEELETTLTLMLAKQKLSILKRDFTKEGIDVKLLKAMLEGNDEESKKYALAIIDDF